MLGFCNYREPTFYFQSMAHVLRHGGNYQIISIWLVHLCIHHTTTTTTTRYVGPLDRNNNKKNPKLFFHFPKTVIVLDGPLSSLCAARSFPFLSFVCSSVATTFEPVPVLFCTNCTLYYTTSTPPHHLHLHLHLLRFPRSQKAKPKVGRPYLFVQALATTP